MKSIGLLSIFAILILAGCAGQPSLDGSVGNNPSAAAPQVNEPQKDVQVEIPSTPTKANEPVNVEPVVCTPNWQCTEWPVCSDLGQQVRTCTDTNYCGTLDGRPSLLQTCTPVPKVTTCPSLSSLINMNNMTKTYTTVAGVLGNVTLLSLNNVSEIEGYKIGWLTCFDDGTCGTICRRGSQIGENTNYYYCPSGIGISLSKTVVDEKGNIIENLYKIATIVVDITFSDSSYINENGGTQFSATRMSYIDTLCKNG